MPTSSPSSGAIPVISVSVQPIAITPITIFENDLENRLKLPMVVCDMKIAHCSCLEKRADIPSVGKRYRCRRSILAAH